MIAVIGAVNIVALLMLVGALNATGFFRALPLILLLGALSFVAVMVAKVNLGPAWTAWAGVGVPTALLLWAAWRPGSSRAKLWIMSGASFAMNSLKWLALIASGLTLLNLSSSLRFMITGAVLAIAVIVDSLARQSRVSHGRA